MSLLRRASRGLVRKEKNNQRFTYGSMNSSNNFCFYGMNGKSTLSLAQLDNDNLPILVISMGGCSNHLANQYPNAIFKTAKSLDELEAILVDVEQNFYIFEQTAKWCFDEDSNKKFLQDVFLPKYYSDNKAEGIEDYKYITELIRENKFIFSRIVIEEVDIISSWIQDEVTKKFDLEVIGTDKKNMSMDWSVYQKEIINYFSRWLRLPCITILSTSERLPSEKQNLTEITPNIAKGATNRLILSLIGNVHYVSNDNKGRYEVTIKPSISKKVVSRQKFIPLLADLDKVPESVDITNNPLLFWEYIEKCKNKEIPMLKIKESNKK